MSPPERGKTIPVAKPTEALETLFCCFLTPCPFKLWPAILYFMHIQPQPAQPAAAPITFDDFLKVDIRVGTIVKASLFPEARKPAYQLHIDFGTPIGIKSSSAQITSLYTLDALIGKQVAAVVNFPPRQIGPFLSEVLTLGFPDKEGHVVLFSPDQHIPNGGKLF